MNAVIKSTLAPLILMLLSGCGAKDEIHNVDPIALPADHPQGPPLSLPSSPTPLRMVTGFELPPASDDYLIPPKPPQAKQGSQPQHVTLLPPIQPLALLPGSRAYYQEGHAYLQLSGYAKDESTLWQKLDRWLLEQQINLTARHAQRKMVTTDWIDWPDAEVKQHPRARYQLSVQRLENKPTLVIQLTEWQPVPSTAGSGNVPPDPHSRRRYTLLLLNHITISWEKERTAHEKQPQPAPSTKSNNQNG